MMRIGRCATMRICELILTYRVAAQGVEFVDGAVRPGDVPAGGHRRPIGASIHEYMEVVEYPDGAMEIQADGAASAVRRYDRIAQIDQGAEVENKRLCCRRWK